jgi:hypothetical protein
LSREEFLALPESEREEIEKKRLEMMRKVDDTYTRLREMEKVIGEKMKEIDLKAGEFAISQPFEEMFRRYDEYPEVINFLKELRDYTLTKLDLFMLVPAQPQLPVAPALANRSFHGVQGECLVDNSSISGPPSSLVTNPMAKHAWENRKKSIGNLQVTTH